MLEAWSRTRDGTRKLSANFTVAEFAHRRRCWWTEKET